MHEEVRCVDTQEYMDLQSLYKESERQLKQVRRHLLTTDILHKIPVVS